MVIMKICIIVHWNLQWSDAFLKQPLTKNLGTQKAPQLKPSSRPSEARADAIAHTPGSLHPSHELSARGSKLSMMWRVCHCGSKHEVQPVIYANN